MPLERGEYIGPSLLGSIEIGESFTPNIIPDWVRILLNKDPNKKLSISIGQSDYSFDLRQKEETLYLTLYDPVKKMSLLQTEFQIVKVNLSDNSILFFPIESTRLNEDNKDLFSGDEKYLARIGKRSSAETKIFDWIGHYMHEWENSTGQAGNTVTSLRLRSLFAIVVGQIARAYGVTEINQEVGPSPNYSPYLYLHPYFLELMKRSAKFGPINKIGFLASVSEKKKKLANEQNDIFFCEYVDPDTAEAGSEGHVSYIDRMKLFSHSAGQKRIQTESDRERNIRKNAVRKALGGIKQTYEEGAFPVYAGDTAPAIICNRKGHRLFNITPGKINNDTRVRILAQGFTNIKELQGSTLIIHNAQAIAYAQDYSLIIPEFIMHTDANHVDFDVGPYLENLAESGNIKTNSGVHKVMIRFKKRIPRNVLLRASNPNSGPGIDFYPNGQLNNELAEYVYRVWINNDGQWKETTLKNSAVRNIILGLSPELFIEITTAFNDRFPISL